MAMSRPKILKLKAGEDYSPLLQPCKDVQILDLISPAAKGLISNLKTTLHETFPKTETTSPTHPTPAYLAANQIGAGHRMVLLYLPGANQSAAKELVLLNPTYTPIDSSAVEAKAQTQAKPEYRISTLFADQFRFRNDLYAAQICVSYMDASGIQQVLYLNGMNAIAAQMGIDFTNGKTPLDRISPSELLEFPNQPAVSKILSKRKAYTYHGRTQEINENDPQFAEKPEQAGLLKDYLQLRQKFPCPAEEKKKPEPAKARSLTAAL